MWFKNIYPLQLGEGWKITTEELEEALSKQPFMECGSEQRESFGFVSPFGKKSDALTHAVNGCILFKFAHQERLLPASVIREELDNAVEELEAKEGRKIGKREKADLRDEIEFELLPQAFKRTKTLDAYFDLKNRWLIVNTASASQAERVTNWLRRVLGSLPVVPPKTGSSPTSVMTRWLSDESEMPSSFTLGERCELQSVNEEKSKASFKNQELTAEEVQANLTAGKQVSSLQVVWAEKMAFVVNHDLVIKSLKFLDMFEEKMKDADPETHEEKLDIEFALMSGEIGQMLGDLMVAFGGESNQGEIGLNAIGVDESVVRAVFASESAENTTDPLYQEGVSLVRETGDTRISFLQVRLKIGYNRACQMLEDMESAGVVSAMNSDGVREVIGVEVAA